MDDAPYGGGKVTESLHALNDVRLLAPAAPSEIFCLRKNYRDNRAEMGYEHDGAPSVFMKGSTTIIGPATTSSYRH
jgi:2-keto-4-pentenoate hydratase/2-oxohepta-3-ene-1,7-dioic acid hydratase in catechol pathway